MKSLSAFALVIGLSHAVTMAQAQQPPAPSRGPIRVVVEQMEALAVANLVDRTEGGFIEGLVAGQFRSTVAEEMRRYGYNMVGMENAMFEVDHSARAELLLGGEVQRLKCDRTLDRNVSICDIAVAWSLFDPRTEKTVYQVLSRSYRMIPARHKLAAADVHELFSGAARSLMARSKFAQAARKRSREPQGATPITLVAEFKECDKLRAKLPKDLKRAMRNVVVLKQGNGLGSGAIVSTDGVVLTAAHLVEGAASVDYQLHDGTTGKASVLRTNKEQDVALLRLDKAVDDCLPLGLKLPPTGAELYVVGTPAEVALSQTVTRGIVSGVRFGPTGFQAIQTDASVSPGNSGGPMLSTDGELVGIVIHKAVGVGVEGLGFAAPTAIALARLGVTPGETTDIAVQSLAPPTADKAPSAPGSIIDVADQMPPTICNAQGYCVRRPDGARYQ